MTVLRFQFRHSLSLHVDNGGAPIRSLSTQHPLLTDVNEPPVVTTDRFSLFTAENAHDEVVRLIRAASHTLVSTDPVQVRVSVPCREDELQLALDDTLEITDTSNLSS